MLLALLVFLVPNMRTLEWVLAALVAIFLPMQFFLPESPRWLLAKGKHERAKRAIRFVPVVGLLSLLLSIVLEVCF